MHYVGYVVIPKLHSDRIEEYVSFILKRYKYHDDIRRKPPPGYKNKFDWYEIGGRWNGMFKNIETYIEHYENFSENVTTIEKLRDTYYNDVDIPMIPYAFINSEGEWNDNVEFDEENEISIMDWEGYFKYDLLAGENPNDLVVVIDFHT